MELLKLLAAGQKTLAVRQNDVVYDLSSMTADIDGAFLASGGMSRAREALAGGSLAELTGVDALRVGAPIARPLAVLCIGQNYAAHATESGNEPPSVPILFFKHPNTVVGYCMTCGFRPVRRRSTGRSSAPW